MDAKSRAAILELHSLLNEMKTVSGRQLIKLRISIIKMKADGRLA